MKSQKTKPEKTKPKRDPSDNKDSRHIYCYCSPAHAPASLSLSKVLQEDKFDLLRKDAENITEWMYNNLPFRTFDEIVKILRSETYHP